VYLDESGISLIASPSREGILYYKLLDGALSKKKGTTAKISGAS